MESVHWLLVLGGRACHRRHAHGNLVGARWNVDCRDGFLWLEGPVFRHATDVSQWWGARSGHCLDQLDRQPRRLLRALVYRRHERPDRQLFGWTLWTGFARSDRCNYLRAVSAHPSSAAVLGGRRPCRMILITPVWRASAWGVRRAKAALSSGCKPHPAIAPAGSNRSSHGGNEVAEAFD